MTTMIAQQRVSEVMCEVTAALSGLDRHTEIQIVMSLMRLIESYDPRLRGHGERTACYALALADAVSLPTGELTHLHRAALLHDLGMLTLPEEILHKDGPLTADEYAVVQSHPRAGAELLRPFSFLRIPAILIAHHHERWDGCGYPYGIRGNLIPLGSRILAVVDTFDALLTDQQYRRSYDVESALGRLQMLAGSQLDPQLVEVFSTMEPIAAGHIRQEIS
jgi:HD-GYP domain-containing protein (c-di-GMP phosphodiesterase class II)